MASSLRRLIYGLQTKVSGILDTHTIGYAFDAKREEDPVLLDAIRDAAASRGFLIVEYEKFFHAHPSGPESYHLDKKRHTNLINILFKRRNSSVYDLECALYDLPEIVSLSMKFEASRYTLTAITDNNQEWTASFTGIDTSGRLEHKFINAKSLGTYPWDEDEQEK